MIGYWDLFQAPFVVFRGTDSHNLLNWIEDIEVLTAPYLKMPVEGVAVASATDRLEQLPYRKEMLFASDVNANLCMFVTSRVRT
jgi:hypothetical protein